MNVSIHSIPLGIDHCYLLQGDGIIMIDGGAPNQAKSFLKSLKKLSIQPKDIHLLVLTHGHWDHIASAKAIKELTGASIAMHYQEKEWLEKSIKPSPPGVTPWGRFVISLIDLYLPLVHIPATDVNIVLGDTEVSLADYGIPGKLLHTPGHSSGSVSILLDTGEVFVGDLAMNWFPLRLTPGLPIFADDMQAVKESWKRLIDRGAKTVYPAHGGPFSVDIIQKALSE
jgi:glyoxylase-like metal-dependent hydrolase (beta-lactamase superfamily II)